ncbi:MAG TPA: hypothetical protein VFS59_16015 [Gemmatimonadaceae bacterium]|nr:hypothetical protein [Gemmatimonadaceae bacterium]
MTVAVAALFAPVDVTLDDGAIVAAPLALQVTVRPCSGRSFPSNTTAVAVVEVFRLIDVLASVS